MLGYRRFDNGEIAASMGQFEELGQRVRALREQMGWSQVELIDRARRAYPSARMNQSDLSRLESGKGISLEKVRAIAKAFRLTTSELLGEVPLRRWEIPPDLVTLYEQMLLLPPEARPEAERYIRLLILEDRVKRGQSEREVG